MTTLRPRGVMPDFEKIHAAEAKRTLTKSSSSKTLTEFQPFTLSSSRRKAAPSTPRDNGTIPSQMARQSLSGIKHTPAGKRVVPPVPLFNEAPITAQTSTPIQPSTAARVIPPVRLFSDAPVPVTPVPPPAIAPVASTVIGSIAAALSAAAAEVEASKDDSFHFSDDGFADGDSLKSILNPDAWKDEESEVVAPLPRSFGSTSILPDPSTPRRSTLTGATAANLLTPRSANRGSIYGGALRTPANRTKVDMTRTPGSRLTISGVLPSTSSLTSVQERRTGSIMPPPSPSIIQHQSRMQTQPSTPIVSRPKDILSESHINSSLFPLAAPSTTTPRSTLARTPAKLSQAVHANFMSPTHASRGQEQENAQSRKYVAI